MQCRQKTCQICSGWNYLTIPWRHAPELASEWVSHETEPVKGGAGVLVRDRAGVLHFRQYIAAAAGQWIARAENPGFADLHSERDGLVVVAVLIAEWGGWH